MEGPSFPDGLGGPSWTPAGKDWLNASLPLCPCSEFLSVTRLGLLAFITQDLP